MTLPYVASLSLQPINVPIHAGRVTVALYQPRSRWVRHDAVFENHTHIGDRRDGGRIVERLRDGGGRFTGDEEHSPADRFGDDGGAYTDCYADAPSCRHRRTRAGTDK